MERAGMERPQASRGVRRDVRGGVRGGVGGGVKGGVRGGVNRQRGSPAAAAPSREAVRWLTFTLTLT